MREAAGPPLTAGGHVASQEAYQPPRPPPNPGRSPSPPHPQRRSPLQKNSATISALPRRVIPCWSRPSCLAMGAARRPPPLFPAARFKPSPAPATTPLSRLVSPSPRTRASGGLPRPLLLLSPRARTVGGSLPL